MFVLNTSIETIDILERQSKGSLKNMQRIPKCKARKRLTLKIETLSSC